MDKGNIHARVHLLEDFSSWPGRLVCMTDNVGRLVSFLPSEDASVLELDTTILIPVQSWDFGDWCSEEVVRSLISDSPDDVLEREAYYFWIVMMPRTKYPHHVYKSFDNVVGVCRS